MMSNTMHNKFFWFGVILITVLTFGAVYVLQVKPIPKTEGVMCTMEAKLCPDGSSVGRGGPACEFAACPTPSFKWIVSEAGVNAQGTPHTNVSVQVGGREYQAGTYAGSCIEVPLLGWEFVPGELSAVLCWFAGGGTELGVFQEGESLVLKKGSVDEGTAEAPGTRGPFETILLIGQHP